MSFLEKKDIFNVEYLFIKDKVFLESGEFLIQPKIAYQTFGKLNSKKDNVIWVCHALTGNTDVSDWWSGIFGKGKVLDPQKYFIVCANYLGSHYGSTNPLSVNPITNEKYYHNFPLITVRDNVNLFNLLRKHLGIPKIHLLIGGSIGSFHALEWSIMFPKQVENLVFIGGSAECSPWAKALNETQRMAIEADSSFNKKLDNAGLNGMKAARSMALLSYRNSDTYADTQKDNNNNSLDNFKAHSYQRYQGEKLAIRFNAFSYYALTKTFDTQNIARNRESLKSALSKITAKTLFVGISTDILFPHSEIRKLQNLLPASSYAQINSIYGHDAFLIEFTQLSNIIVTWKNSMK